MIYVNVLVGRCKDMYLISIYNAFVKVFLLVILVYTLVYKKSSQPIHCLGAIQINAMLPSVVSLQVIFFTILPCT